MKITEAVFYTDNTTIRLETDAGRFYLDAKLKKFYDIHPVNVYAKELDKDASKTLLTAVNVASYPNIKEVKQLLKS